MVQGLKTSLLWSFGLVSGLLGCADRADNDFFNRLKYSRNLFLNYSGLLRVLYIAPFVRVAVLHATD